MSQIIFNKGQENERVLEMDSFILVDAEDSVSLAAETDQGQLIYIGEPELEQYLICNSSELLTLYYTLSKYVKYKFGTDNIKEIENVLSEDSELQTTSNF